MRIYWSFQAMAGLADGLDADAVHALLGEGERRVYGNLSFAKRRTEWLGGRLAVKDLARRAVPRFASLAMNQVEILIEASGAPRLWVRPGLQPAGSISLSHSHNHVFCMLSPQKVPLGADLETIEPRSKEFIEDYFTPEEVQQVCGLPTREQPFLATLIWSAKEAVLKALSLGLHVDTRSVQALLPEGTPLPGDWHAMDVQSSLIQNNSLRLLWRREGKFVLTACIPRGWEGRLEKIGS